MSRVQSMSCGLLCWQNAQKVETTSSLAIRITAMVVGVIGMVAAALILFKIPGLHQLSTTVGWTTLSISVGFYLMGVLLRCERKQPSSIEQQDSFRAPEVPKTLDPVLQECRTVIGANIPSRLSTETIEIDDHTVIIHTPKGDFGIISDQPEQIKTVSLFLKTNVEQFKRAFTSETPHEHLGRLAKTIKETMTLSEAVLGWCFVDAQTKTYSVHTFNSTKVKIHSANSFDPGLGKCTCPEKVPKIMKIRLQSTTTSAGIDSTWKNEIPCTSLPDHHWLEFTVTRGDQLITFNYPDHL